MKAIYTPAAEKELAKFHEQQQKLLEEFVAQRKAVFGDDEVEVTASDIREATSHVGELRLRPSSFRLTDLVTKAYMGLGVVLMATSIVYPDLIALLEERKPQALMFLLGVGIAGAGWFLRYWVELRRKVLEDRLDLLSESVVLKRIGRIELEQSKSGPSQEPTANGKQLP